MSVNMQTFASSPLVGLHTKQAALAKLADSDPKVKKAEEAAKDFEAVFIAEMLKPMFDDIKTDGAFGGGKGEEIFRGMMLDEYGKMIAQTGTIGLSKQIKEQMIAMQEQADNGSQKK